MRWAGWWWTGVFCSVSVACGGDSPSGGGAITIPDGGSPDGGPQADCSDLLPAPPGAAVTFDVAGNPGEVCTTAVGDGEGVIAGDTQPASESLKRWYEFAPPYGQHGGTFQSPGIVPQPKGFIGLFGTPVNVTLWDSGGTVLNTALVGTAGAVVLGRASGSGVISLSASSIALTVRKHDAGANELLTAIVPGAFTPRAVAEDVSGVVLALTGAGTTVSGLWVDLAKGTAGQSFAVGTGSAVSARPLLGGGVAVQLDGRWAGSVVPGESALRTAPPWLGNVADFVPVRGGKAYALLPQSGNVIGIVSPQGTSCGSVTFPGVSNVSVGLDGSAIGGTGARGCTKVVWRNVLR
jgi:hypothetical protein